MVFTDLNLALEKKLVAKLDLMIDRCEKKKPIKDNVLIIDGGEGEGKTSLSSAIGYYVHFMTSRPFSNKNIFFNAKPMMEFAQNTEKQIIIYDEPALDLLSNEWWKKEQRNLIKLMMMIRKRQHFFIFNVTKFNKFPEYIIVDRAMGFIHVYSRNETEAGRMIYIKKKFLEALYNDYRTKRIRNFAKYAAFYGTFPDALEKIIDIKKYEKEKDKAIMSIGNEVSTKVDKKRSKEKQEIMVYKLKLASATFPIENNKQLANLLGVSRMALSNWKKLDLNQIQEVAVKGKDELYTMGNEETKQNSAEIEDNEA